jgi:flagellar M-ring protein FliF
MALDLKQLGTALRGASPRTLWTAIGGAVAIALVCAVGNSIASRPRFVMLYSGLDDHARAGVEKALAESGVRYRVSQPPAPFVVYVDEPELYVAQNKVALSDALQTMPHGIDTTSGASSIFMSSAERQQSVLKREWQEMERQLRTLEFVAGATVVTSTPDVSPLRTKQPPTVSVTLALRNAAGLSPEQAANVAALVRFRFGVPAENVIITDQNGRTLSDGARVRSGATASDDLIEHGERYDSSLAEKINTQLALAYGKDQALVAITSEWDHDQRTTVAETLEPKGTLVSEEKTDTRTPLDAAPATAGGPAGVSSNVASSDSNAAQANPAPPPPATDAEDRVSSSTESRRQYETARTRTQTVHTAPILRRLSVSVVLDEGLAEKKDEIASLVRAAVGFDETRKDVISVSTAPLVATGAAAQTEPPNTEEPSTPLSPAVVELIERSIEIAAAAAFLFVLYKALRGSIAAGGKAQAMTGGAEGADLAADPALVARVKIEELARNDPRRLGEILSRWADESEKPVGANR